MAILDLVPYTDPILRTKLEEFDFVNPPVDPVELAKDLCDTCIHHGALGLSANQVGLPYRVFVVRSAKMLACFNPKIVDVSEKKILLDEGCLSYPNLSVKVRRPEIIRIRYTTPNGDIDTYKYSGLTARAMLHETDHLDGITFLQQCSIVQKQKAMKLLKQQQRKR